MKNLLVLIIPLLFSVNVRGEVIGSFSDYGGTGSTGIYSDIDFDIAFYDWSAIHRVGALFDDLSINEADAGNNYIATASTDPYFHNAVDLLTNGEIDGIGEQSGFVPCSGTEPCGGSAGTEANRFFGGSQTDFYGYFIDYIELIIDSVEFYRDTTSNRTDVSLSYTVNIHGEVPPPPIEVSISVPFGMEHECTSPSGANVLVTSTIDTFDPDAVYSVSWIINGELYGNAEFINPLLPIDTNELTVTATLSTGETATDTVIVK